MIRTTAGQISASSYGVIPVEAIAVHFGAPEGLGILEYIKYPVDLHALELAKFAEASDETEAAIAGLIDAVIEIVQTLETEQFFEFEDKSLLSISKIKTIYCVNHGLGDYPYYVIHFSGNTKSISPFDFGRLKEYLHICDPFPEPQDTPAALLSGQE